MPQAVWTGYVSFVFVNIPVKLYSTTAPKDVRFHHYEAGTGRRIRYSRVASGPAPERVSPRPVVEPDLAEAPPHTVEEPSTEPPAVKELRDPTYEREVPWEDVVKGYEIEPGRVVHLTPEELSEIAPERSRVLEVEQFVDIREIDPVHFEKSYYVVPRSGIGAEHPYWLLLQTLKLSRKAAVGRFVMRTHEYLAAIRAAERVLILQTLFYADEVRDVNDVWLPLVEEAPERELRVARQLVEAMSGDWDGSRYRDEHRARVLDLLRSKSGDAFIQPRLEEETPPPAVADLMDALKASVEVAKRARAAKGGSEDQRTG
jgi:DNA end-binding protein Ku